MFGDAKKDGVICVYRDCFKFLNSQKFKAHFIKKHLPPGERYTSAHRDRYERTLLDPDLLDLADDGPLKALLVASMARIAHYMRDVDERMQRIEAVLAAAVTAYSDDGSDDGEEGRPRADSADCDASAGEETGGGDEEEEEEAEAPTPPPTPPRRAPPRKVREGARQSPRKKTKK